MALSLRGHQIKACTGGELLKKDRIIELPDDVLLDVLSLLTMDEAGRTSVLSKRWKHVWAYVPTLNFDASKTLEELMLGNKSLEIENARYVSWVDQVVSSHKAPTIDEFRVRFDVQESSRQSVDNWVRFAMEKRVKRLEMNFLDYSNCHQLLCYTFPNSISFNSLTTLQLACVNITGEVLERFLYNCQALEFLSVEFSETLVDLKVDGPSLKLKYLKIFYCWEMKHLEISASNLVSFIYLGSKINVPFKSTPKLAEIFIGGDYGIHLSNNFLELSSYLSQIEVLHLYFPCKIKYIMKNVEFPVCPRLKRLHIRVNPSCGEDLFCFSSLIKACPFLHKFVLQISLLELDIKRRRAKNREAWSHYNLKIVEIVGFVGRAIDLEFAMYLMENVVSLEKIIVDPREVRLLGTPWEAHADKRKRARKQAEQLRAKLKPGTELLIL